MRVRLGQGELDDRSQSHLSRSRWDARQLQRIFSSMDDRPSTEPQSDEPVPARPRPKSQETHPISVDELSEWSFPASDAPATWTWDPDSPRHS